MNYRICAGLTLVVAAFIGCSEPSSPARGASAGPQLSFARSATLPDPTATVKVPLADGALSVRSDGKFSDGTYSTYSEGVCGVKATIFLSGSGDMVMDAGNPRYADKKCTSYPRKVTVAYPDATSETISGPLVSVNELETSAYRIPVGSSALRHFHVRTSTTRCDGVHWGDFGGDSILVTRTAADTWHVQTQPYPNDNAACKSTAGNYVLGHMPVDLWIVSSRALQ